MKRIAMVTGGSRGIGAAVCRRLARDGFQVVINYHQREDAARALAEEIRREGGFAEVVWGDVSQEESARQMVAFVKERFGTLDVLVNSAGIAHYGMLMDTADADFDRVFDINVKGTFHMCREAVKEMYWQRTGRIINIASMWGLCGASCEAIYAASKAAVIGLTKSLAKELGPSGITVNCVAPGAIRTDMMAELPPEAEQLLREETPLGRIGEPEEIAAVVAFLASKEASFMTGQVLSPNGGLVI